MSTLRVGVGGIHLAAGQSLQLTDTTNSSIWEYKFQSPAAGLSVEIFTLWCLFSAREHGGAFQDKRSGKGSEQWAGSPKAAELEN